MPELRKRFHILGLFTLALAATTSLSTSAAAAEFVSLNSIASGGDINGDGIDDLIGNVDFRRPDDSIDPSFYVVFGRASGGIGDFTSADFDGVKGFRLVGMAGLSWSNVKIAGAGDVNGDGYGDFIMGGAPVGEYFSSSYVVFGKASGFPAKFNVAKLDGSNGFRLDGGPFTNVYLDSVAGAGYINGDGFDDLIVGEVYNDHLGNYERSAYIVFGKAQSFAASIKLSSLNGSNGFRLDSGGNGWRVDDGLKGAGDVNGDGFDDLILGSFLDGQPGSSFVVFGKASGFAASSDIESLSGSNGFRIDGIPGFRIGFSVDGAGDVNGDGFDDLIIGAASSNQAANISGSTYVVYGKASGFAPSLALSSIDGSNGFRLDAPYHTHHYWGSCTVAGRGDINGDGFEGNVN